MGEGERGKLELEIPRGLQEFSLYPNTSAVLETPRKYPKPQKTVSVILPVYRTKASRIKLCQRRRICWPIRKFK